MASLDRDSIRHIVLQLKLQRAVHCMRLLGPDFREEMDQTVTRLHLPPGKLASPVQKPCKACPVTFRAFLTALLTAREADGYQRWRAG